MSNDEARQILQYLRNLQSVIDVLIRIASRFDKAVEQIEKMQGIDDVVRELGDYLTANIDRLDRMMLLILEKLPDRGVSERVKQETAELRQETIKNRIRSLRIQIKQHQSNLNWAEEQAAQYGPTVTLEITNKIIWEREKIKELQAELDYLRQQGR